jgi:DNA mismatch endonuclease (patch repair protein)
MANVKLHDGPLETAIRSELHRNGYRFRKHVKSLPGKPDLVFPKAKVAVFIDGDFWHGYRLPSWEHKLSDFWRDKLIANRERDRRNFRRLRTMGWHVIRIWQHQIEKDFESCISKIIVALKSDEKGTFYNTNSWECLSLKNRAKVFEEAF